MKLRIRSAIVLSFALLLPGTALAELRRVELKVLGMD